MTFFQDLTTHSYTRKPEAGVLNVGWLDPPNAFSQGETSTEFQEALQELCTRPILLHRGFHLCGFCPSLPPPTLRGNGQIRVLSRAGIWYAAPMLVHHYVSAHSYRPPDEFIDAVLDPAQVATE